MKMCSDRIKIKLENGERAAEHPCIFRGRKNT